MLGVQGGDGGRGDRRGKRGKGEGKKGKRRRGERRRKEGGMVTGVVVRVIAEVIWRPVLLAGHFNCAVA